jgi:hypothetical protein
MHGTCAKSLFCPYAFQRLFAFVVMSCLNTYAWAQAASSPTPGQWEVTSASTGMPRGHENSSRSACLTSASFSDGIENAFRKIAAENAKGRQPECKYDMTAQQQGTNAWNASCKGGPLTINGNGRSTWNAANFSLNEKLSGQSPMGELNIQRTITAKRLGDCTE